jgi:hypothetical protein
MAVNKEIDVSYLYPVPQRFVQDYGGRQYINTFLPARDCVTRSVAIASGREYGWVASRVRQLCEGQPLLWGLFKTGPNIGVQKEVVDMLMAELGFHYTPLNTYLRRWKFLGPLAGELPGGRLVVFCNKHVTAVIDGVIHDAIDPVPYGIRQVFGYWSHRSTESLR